MKNENMRIILVIGGEKPHVEQRECATQAVLDELVNGFTAAAKRGIQQRAIDDDSAVECYLLHEARAVFATRQLPLIVRGALAKLFSEWQPAAGTTKNADGTSALPG